MSMGPGTLKALFADVGVVRRARIVEALKEAGWSVHAEAADGAEALIAALARRGWDVVIYAGEGAAPVPARKAIALVRTADPQLPFAVSMASVRPGDLSAFVQGFGPEAIVAPDPAHLPELLAPVLEAAHDARPDADAAHRMLLAQQEITGHIAAGPPPDELCARVLGTLGEALSRPCGAVWRPRGEAPSLRAAATWYDPAAGPEVAAFAARAKRMAIAPGRGLAGRAYAFRRPSWVADVRTDGSTPRHAYAATAGLLSAVAFPLALGDECAGVIEFHSGALREPGAGEMALFATVGGQLAQYLERRRLQADEVRELEAELAAERARADRLAALLAEVGARVDPG